MKTADQWIAHIKLAASRGEHRKVMKAWDTVVMAVGEQKLGEGPEARLMVQVHRACVQEIMAALANVPDDYFES